jgi:hypothetical protein
MIGTTFKWISRCLGWIVLGCLAMGVIWVYFMDKKIGYGGLEMRLIWKDMTYSLDQQGLASAELEIQGKHKAWETGKSIRLRPGPIHLQLKLKHFYPCSVATNIVKNVRTIVELRLDAEPRSITIGNLISNTTINGQPQTGMWVLTNAEVGRVYRIEAVAPGYYTNLLALMIENPGQDLVTNLVWRPLMGFVSARVTPCPDGTIVTIDGNLLEPVTGGAVVVGMHLLCVSNTDYIPWNQRIKVAHGLTNHCEIVLRPRPASLAVEVAPAVQYQIQDSAGRLVQLNNGMAELPPGTNILIISAKYYNSQHQEFVTEPNKRYTWKVQLEQAPYDPSKSKESPVTDPTTDPLSPPSIGDSQAAKRNHDSDGRKGGQRMIDHQYEIVKAGTGQFGKDGKLQVMLVVRDRSFPNSTIEVQEWQANERSYKSGNAQFTIDLPVGKYIVRALVRRSGEDPRWQKAKVTVSADLRKSTEPHFTVTNF